MQQLKHNGTRNLFFITSARCCLIFLFCFFYTVTCRAQNAGDEQLRKQLRETKTDSARSRVIGELINLIRFSSSGEALKLAREKINIDSAAADYSGMSHGYRIIGQIFRMQGNPESSKIMLDRSIDLGRKGGDSLSVAKAIVTKATIFMDFADYETGLKMNLYASGITKGTTDLQFLCTLNNNIVVAILGDHGLISLSAEDFEKSKNYLYAALRYGLASNYTYMLGLIYSNLGELYSRMGIKDSTARYDSIALAFNLGNEGRSQGYGHTCGTVGYHYKSAGNLEQAEYYFLEGIAVLDSIGDSLSSLALARNLSLLYLEFDHPEKTGPYIQRIQREAERQKNNGLFLDAYRLLRIKAEKEKDYVHVSEYLKMEIAFSDSIAIETQARNMANTEMLHQLGLAELERKYKTKEQEAQLAEGEAERKNLLLLSVVIIVSLLIIIAIAFYAYYQKKKVNAELHIKKGLLRKQSADKDIFLSEIHHRVKNNLQLISSMLNLQMNAIEDKKFAAAIQESLLRVRSISLVHEQLYQAEDVEFVSIFEYVRSLTDNLKSTLSENKADVIIHVNPADIQLDLDSAISVGLIVNELMTNSLKYAITAGKNSVITITIDRVSNGNYTMMFSDNGPGLPPDFDLKTTHSLGIRLIRQLAKQLKGTVEISNTSGANFAFSFRNASGRKAFD